MRFINKPGQAVQTKTALGASAGWGQEGEKEHGERGIKETPRRKGRVKLRE